MRDETEMMQSFPRLDYRGNQPSGLLRGSTTVA
jgi:hypothetical protein